MSRCPSSHEDSPVPADRATSEQKLQALLSASNRLAGDFGNWRTQSGNPKSPHFNDQADRYSRGDLREVYFYPAQLTDHTKRTYRPGK